MSTEIGCDMPICGIRVRLPFKPYPAQVQLMVKVITGLKNSQNCLLESPTGSGKTMALLCATLAWQADEFVKKRKHEAEQQEKLQAYYQSHSESMLDTSSIPSLAEQSQLCTCGAMDETESDEPQDVMSEEDDDDDFVPVIPLKKPKPPRVFKHTTDCPMVFFNKAETPVPPPNEPTTEKYYVPKIYYGTRTHKQITQIVDELKRTYYRDVKMDILASREQGTCIHEYVSRVPNKNEECRKLITPMLRDENNATVGCNYKANAIKIDQQKLFGRHEGPWDLEEFVELCKRRSICPYFATKDLLREASIIFCPYSYLIDPYIRKSMGIKLEKDVIILDEAHNIEDASREAASLTLSFTEVAGISDDLDKVQNYPEMRRAIKSLAEYIESAGNKIVETEVGGSAATSSPIGGAELHATIHGPLSLDPTSFELLKKELDELKADLEAQAEEKANGGPKAFAMTPKEKEKQMEVATVMKAQSFFEHYAGVLEMVNKSGEDFRLIISKQQVAVRDTSVPPPGRYMSPGNRGVRHEIVFSLSLWCLNPSIIFQEVAKQTRSIILASGTLSPMNSFQAELGTTFELAFEALHVISPTQIFTAALGVSPSGQQMRAVRGNMEQLSFQDNLGDIISQVCGVVPGGILCFFPNYRIIGQCVERWKTTGLYAKISARKAIFSEQTRPGERFEELLAQFYAAAKPSGPPIVPIVLDDDLDEADEMFNRRFTRPKKPKIDQPRKQLGTRLSKGASTASNGEGALFLAVFRGKVSEGINFSDDYARAVIAVGIPYPPIKDPLVNEKRNYNDARLQKSRSNSRGTVMSGSDWYDCQAFRALNQALGRCLRHKNDWGSLILVDERFCQSGPSTADSKLSKWMRAYKKSFNNFNQFMESLSTFVKSEKFGKPTSSNSTVATPIQPQSTPVRPNVKVSLSPYFASDNNVSFLESKIYEKPKDSAIIPLQDIVAVDTKVLPQTPSLNMHDFARNKQVLAESQAIKQEFSNSVQYGCSKCLTTFFNLAELDASNQIVNGLSLAFISSTSEFITETLQRANLPLPNSFPIADNAKQVSKFMSLATSGSPPMLVLAESSCHRNNSYYDRETEQTFVPYICGCCSASATEMQSCKAEPTSCCRTNSTSNLLDIVCWKVANSAQTSFARQKLIFNPHAVRRFEQ